MQGLTFPKVSIATGPEVKGFAFFVVLDQNIMEIPFNKKIDTMLKWFHDHVVRGMLNIFTRVSNILDYRIESEGGKVVQHFVHIVLLGTEPKFFFVLSNKI